MLRGHSIRSRILVLVLVPVLALAGLYAVLLNLTIGQLITLRQAANVRNAITNPVTAVQDRLETELGYALQYVAKPSPASLHSLLVQERLTDIAVRACNVAVAAAWGIATPKERQALRTFQADLAGLNAVRVPVVSTALSKAAAAGSYANIVADGDKVLTQAIVPLAINSAGLVANGLITLNAALHDMSEESGLIRADLIARTFPPGDRTLISQLSVQRQLLSNQALPTLDPLYQSYFDTMIPSSATKDLRAMEARVLVGPGAASTVSLPTWISAESTYATGFHAAFLRSVAGVESTVQGQAGGVLLRLILTGILGLLAMAAVIAVALLISRNLLRQLDDLRRSALQLASHGLPDAIERLRAGEDIERQAEAPLLASSPDEIGQVKQAFNSAAQTAVAAAVEEIKIRQGVNDVFRNLARRNQSLLTRQLQLLDAMERRVHEPEQLADLFKIDHLTTRMRRHAEGLLIVAGGSSGRTWREAVPIVDVMRAAIAEVENYTRIRVLSRAGAALAGHAVADVIHLLAELVENATMFSPGNTPVRIESDMVAKGLAVEIEDRGLGIGETRLAEINATLADPPMFDLSGSDQLGLFIAGQLAKRHDIKITLRSSAYGGITAVVVIPTPLVVALEPDELPPAQTRRELGGRPVVAELPSSDGADAASAEPTQASHAQPPVPATVGTSPPPQTQGAPPLAGDSPSQAPPPFAASAPSGTVPPFTTHVLSGTTTSPLRTAADDDADAPARAGYPDLASGIVLPSRRPMRPPADWPGIGQGAPNGSAQPMRSEPDEPANDGPDELPTRVRQANLAPQLRDQGPRADTARDQGSGPILDAAEPATASPEEARNIMAALQRGWERGRQMPDPSAEELPADPPDQEP